jgi:pyridoxal phosphate enzyme (YggS family)
MNDIADNLERVRARIEAAAKAAGRDPRSVALVAVSKTHPADAVLATLAAGQLLYGENRVQEGQKKFPALRAAYPNLNVHLLGPLQTNKANDAVATFDAIHSLDRPKLMQSLADAMTKTKRRPNCFLQVNTGREPQKAGVSPEDIDSALARAKEEYKLPVIGLMCIPPADVDPVPHFSLLRDLARRHALPCLSMGMSHDYELAIAHGATHVRVGTAIFGSRPPLVAAEG